MGKVFCPINGSKGTRRLTPQQCKRLRNKGQTCRDVDKEEEGHNQVQYQKSDLFQLWARIDVTDEETSGQKEVDWGNDERDCSNGYRCRPPEDLF